PARSTGRARCAPSTPAASKAPRSAAATSSSRGTGGRCASEGRERHAREDQADAGEVMPGGELAEEERRKHDAERGHEVERDAGPRGAEPRDDVGPARIGEKERADRRVGDGRRTRGGEVNPRA